MVVKTAWSRLPEELKKQLETYDQSIIKSLNEAYKELAEEGVAKLKSTHPYRDRSGKYSKSFEVAERENAVSVTGAKSYAIHSKKHYRLTHLLEHGHRIVTRKGKIVGETHTFKHWDAAQEAVESKVERAIRDAIQEAGNS